MKIVSPYHGVSDVTTAEWIYERDGNLLYRRQYGSDKREILYKHPNYGPPYTMHCQSGEEQWIDVEDARKRYWYKDYIKENSGDK